MHHAHGAWKSASFGYRQILSTAAMGEHSGSAGKASFKVAVFCIYPGTDGQAAELPSGQVLFCVKSRGRLEQDSGLL